MRGAIVTRIRARRTNREIEEFNNISVNIVKSFAGEYHSFIEDRGKYEDFDIKRKQHRRRSDTHSMEIVEKVQEVINDVPGWSMRKLAEELEVSEWLIRKTNVVKPWMDWTGLVPGEPPVLLGEGGLASQRTGL